LVFKAAQGGNLVFFQGNIEVVLVRKNLSDETSALFFEEDFKKLNATQIVQKERSRYNEIVARISEYNEKIRIEEQKRLRAAMERQRETFNGHTIHTGPRGGKFYYNSSGGKTYVPR